MAMSVEQQRALALAQARLRVKSQPQPEIMPDVLKSGASGVGIGLGGIADAFNPVNYYQELKRTGGNLISLAEGKPEDVNVDPSMPLTRYMASLYQPETEYGRFAQSGAAGATGGAIFGPAGAISGLGGGLIAPVGGDVAVGAFGEDARPYGEFLGGLLGGKMGNSAYYAGRDMLLDPVGNAREAVRTRTSDAWDAVDESGMRLKKSSVRDFAVNAAEELKMEGFTPTEHKFITRALDDLASKPQEDLRPAGIQAFLKRLDTAPEDQSTLAKMLKRKVNDYLDNVGPQDVGKGSVTDAGLLKAARSATRDKKSFELADMTEKEIRLKAAGTTKPTRSIDRFRNIALDEEQMGYLKPEQRTYIEQAAAPTNMQLLLREGGKLMPNRLLGFGAAGVGIGASAASGVNPIFAIPNLIGAASELGYRSSVNNASLAALNALRGLPQRRSYGLLTTPFNMQTQDAMRSRGLLK